MRALPFALSLALLAGCAAFPDLDAAVSDRARASDYPRLVPSGQIIEARDNGGRLTEEDGPRLLARAERLRARGAILRALPTIDEATRIRISDRLNALGG